MVVRNWPINLKCKKIPTRQIWCIDQFSAWPDLLCGIDSLCFTGWVNLLYGNLFALKIDGRFPPPLVLICCIHCVLLHGWNLLCMVQICCVMTLLCLNIDFGSTPQLVPILCVYQFAAWLNLLYGVKIHCILLGFSAWVKFARWRPFCTDGRRDPTTP